MNLTDHVPVALRIEVIANVFNRISMTSWQNPDKLQCCRCERDACRSSPCIVRQRIRSLYSENQRSQRGPHRRTNSDKSLAKLTSVGARHASPDEPIR